MKAINYREWKDLDTAEQQAAVRFYMGYHLDRAMNMPKYFEVYPDCDLTPRLKAIVKDSIYRDDMSLVELILDDDYCGPYLSKLSNEKAMTALYEPEFMKYDIVTSDQLKEVQGR